MKVYDEKVVVFPPKGLQLTTARRILPRGKAIHSIVLCNVTPFIKETEILPNFLALLPMEYLEFDIIGKSYSAMKNGNYW